MAVNRIRDQRFSLSKNSSLVLLPAENHPWLKHELHIDGTVPARADARV
jgi:hypothetical protein